MEDNLQGMDRAQEQRDSVLRQLQQQIQFARLRGNQAEVDRLQAQIDDINEGSAPGTGETAEPTSVADAVQGYQQKYPEIADNAPQMPTGTGESYETIIKPPASSSVPSSPQPSMGQAPSYKNSEVQPDYSNITSLADILSSDKSARKELQDKLDEAEAADDESYKSGSESRKKSYEEGKNRNQWLDVAERVAQAVAQYGAARQGLRDNVDLSGLKFDRHDYSKDTDQLMKERAVDDEAADKIRAIQERRRAALGSRGEDEANRTLAAALKGREEDVRMAEKSAKEKSDTLSEENRFNLSRFATEESARRYVDAAKERAKDREERGKDRELLDAQRRQDKLDAEARARAEREGTRAEKADAKVDKLAGDASGALGLIADRKTKTKGTAQLKDSLSELGASPEELDQVNKTIEGRGFFGDSQDEVDAKLMQQIKIIRERAKQRISRGSAPIAPKNSGQDSGQTSANTGMVKVRLKANGKTGQIPAANFDPSTMDKI